MKPGETNKLYLHAILNQIFGEELVKTEWRFHHVRRWRFDFGIPEIKLAVEYNGHAGFVGKFGPSGHSSITGLTKDAEKLNDAIGQGWRVLQFTALHFRHNDRLKHNLTEPRQAIMNALAAMQNERESR